MANTRIVDTEQDILNLIVGHVDPTHTKWPRYGRWVGPGLGIEDELVVHSTGPTFVGENPDMRDQPAYEAVFTLWMARICHGAVLLEINDGRTLVQPTKAQQNEFAGLVRDDQVVVHALLHQNRRTLFARAYPDGDVPGLVTISTGGIEQTGPSFVATVDVRVPWKTSDPYGAC